MKKLILLFTLILSLLFGEDWGGAAYAQKTGQELIDSLQTALSKSRQDTNSVKILTDLSTLSSNTGNYDTAIYFAQSALKLARKLNYKKGEADAHISIGVIYWHQGSYPEGLKSYQTAIKLYEAVSYKRGIADCYSNMGLIYSDQSNYPEGLKNLMAALKIYESIGNKSRIANCYLNMGNIYADQGNFPEALKNYFASLKIYESTGNKKGIATGYMNVGIIYSTQGNSADALKNHTAALKVYESIGNKNGIAACYSNIGEVYKDQGNYPEALKNYRSALEIYESIGVKNGIAACYNNIGLIYSGQGNYSGALKNYISASKINKETGNINWLAKNYNNIGIVYAHLGKAREGKSWLQNGLELSSSIGATGTIKESYSGLAEADSALGNYKGALENYKMFITFRDSLYNEDNTKKLTQTSMQYEFDKKHLADSLQNVQVKKLAAEKLSKQKTYTALGAGLAVLLLGFSGLVFRNNKKLAAEKQKSEDLLHNILPEEVSDELKQRGATTAKEFDAVTVLFTDFVNFTTAGERMSPKELVEELHFCFKTFDQIIDKYAIEKIKTVGDAYLAVSGLPNAHPQHAQNIVKAAKEIRDFMLERRAVLGDKTFEIRIGIHSGPVVAGIVGVKKFAYDIWGDTVNTAARMEQSGEAGKINISETTHELVKDDFECVYRGEIDAKGKGKMKMYFVK